MGDFHPGNLALSPGDSKFNWVWIDNADTERLDSVSMTNQCKTFRKIFLMRLVQELGTPYQAIDKDIVGIFDEHVQAMAYWHVEFHQADFKIDDLANKFKGFFTRKTNASAVGHLQPAPTITQASSEVSAVCFSLFDWLIPGPSLSVVIIC